MPVTIGNNIAAINAGRNLNINNADVTKRIERLSSGLRINRGADDVAGLSVSEGMRSELLGMRQSIRNAEQGASLLQSAEGSLNEVSNMLIRMRELAVQSANSSLNDSNRMQQEFLMLEEEIDRIALTTTYNKKMLLTGFGNAVSQTGSVSTALQGFSGVNEISISGAVPGTYIFSDTSAEDNQIMLSITLDDGTQLSQSIDVGSSLDRSEGTNLVATGTTFLANFDRLGVQVTMLGPEVDKTSTTLKSQVTGGGAGGNIIIDGDAFPISPGESLANIAARMNTVLGGLSTPGFAVFDANLNEIQIETAGNTFVDSGNILNTIAANSYIDGRLDGKRIVIEQSEGGVLQVGPNNDDSNRLSVTIGDMRASGPILNLSGVSVATIESSKSAIGRIDWAIQAVARQRGDLGAMVNRLQFATQYLESAIENTQAAESAIRDADVAEEVAQFTSSQIMTQAATAMVAQANAIPQSALQLLQ